MPAELAVPNTIAVRFLFSQGGLPAETIQYALYTGGPPVAGDLNDMAQALGADWWSNVQSIYCITTSFVAVTCQDLNTLDGAVSTYSFNAFGTDEATSSPASSAVLCSHTIARRYRGGHPRTYYPPPSTDHLSGPSTWDSTTVTAFNSAQTGYNSTLGGASWGSFTTVYPVSVSRILAGSPRTTPVLDEITSSVVEGLIRSQRRRLTSRTY
jgi:hypothetical protein